MSEAVHRLSGPAALDRGGITEPDPIVEQTGAGTQVPHHVLHDPGEAALAFVVAGLLRNIGEGAGQMLPDVSDKASFGGETEEGFHDRRDNNFAATAPGLVPGPRPDRHELRVDVEVVVGGDIGCCCESVEIVVHNFDSSTLSLCLMRSHRSNPRGSAKNRRVRKPCHFDDVLHSHAFASNHSYSRWRGARGTRPSSQRSPEQPGRTGENMPESGRSREELNGIVRRRCREQLPGQVLRRLQRCGILDQPGAGQATVQEDQ